MYQVTFAVRLTVILNVLADPTVSLTGDEGVDPVITGGASGADVTFQIQVCIALPLLFVATALTFQIPTEALAFV
jgi:hypothetical protein